MANARQLATASREKPVSRPPGRREPRPKRTAFREAARRPRNAGCRRPWPGRRAAAAVGRSAAPWSVWRSGRTAWRTAVGGFFGKLAEGEGPHAVDDEAVGGVAIAGRRPSGRSRADQHRAGDRRGLAQRLLERANRGGAGGDPDALRATLLARRADWRRPRSSGAGSTATVSHAAPSSSATICGSAVQMPCPVSICGTATVIRPSRAILMKLPNACSPPAASSLVEMARPQREGDDQSDARAAADQQGAAIELQCAYCAFSARRSILPVPRRGSGSAEKMKRAGILNLASSPSRNARSSASLSARRPSDR